MRLRLRPGGQRHWWHRPDTGFQRSFVNAGLMEASGAAKAALQGAVGMRIHVVEQGRRPDGIRRHFFVRVDAAIAPEEVEMPRFQVDALHSVGGRYALADQ